MQNSKTLFLNTYIRILKQKVKLAIELSIKINLIRAYSIIKGIYKLPKRSALLFAHDFARGGEVNGKAYSYLIDSVDDELSLMGIDSMQLCLPNSSLFGDKTYKNAQSIQQLFEFTNRCKKNLESLGSKFLSKILKQILPCSDYSVYVYALRITKAKFVIALNTPKGLSQAGRNLNRPILELMHGIGYTEGSSYLQRFKKNPNSLPSHILTLDKITTQNLLKININNIKIIEINHPWYKNIGTQKNKLAEVQYSKYQELSRISSYFKKSIIVSLQWGYDGTIDGFPKLPDGLLVNELLPLIELTKESVFWMIRRHPVQIRSPHYDHQIDKLDDIVSKYPNCEWRLSTTCPLNYLCQIADGHITMSSMTAYDCSLMGVKTTFVCPSLKHNEDNTEQLPYRDLIENGFAILSELDYPSLEQWIYSVNKISPYSISSVKDTTWKKLVLSLMENPTPKPHIN